SGAHNLGLEKFVIQGGHNLKGEVTVSGSKNSVLPVLAATFLAHGPCTINNAPRLRDVVFLRRILQTLGVTVQRHSHGAIRTNLSNEDDSVAPYELVTLIHANFCVLGPLPAKRGYAKVSLPGGRAFGDRPVELHLKGLKALGAEIKIE